MKDDWAPIVLLIALVVVFIVVMTAVAMTVGGDEWQPTEDPACVLHIQYDNSLFHENTETITRYCKEER